MQLPTGGAQAIAAASENTTALPHVPEKGPKRTRIWWLVLAAIVVAGCAGLYLQQQRSLQAEQSRVTRSAFRSAPVAPAAIVRSIRLNGVTAAESYVSLLTPQLHGRRGGGGGGGGGRSSGSGSVQMPPAVASNSGTSSSSSSSGAASSSSSPGIGASRGFSAKNAFQAS
ncbi:MAG: hypothetical protein NTY38_03755, partial [Acidobacteria bacterium]|nr:hypothetical protein [Acidobacteriota bacterium]